MNEDNQHRLGHKASDEVKLRMSDARYEDAAVKKWLKPTGLKKRQAEIVLESLPDLIDSHQFLLGHQTRVAGDDEYMKKLEIAKSINKMLETLK